MQVRSEWPSTGKRDQGQTDAPDCDVRFASELEGYPQRELAKATLVVVAAKGEGSKPTLKHADRQRGRYWASNEPL